VGLLALAAAALAAGLAQRLLATSRRLRALLDTMLDPFFVYCAVRDRNGEIVDFRCDYANDAGSALVGGARTPVGATISELWPGYRERPLFAHHRELMRTGEPLQIEERFGDRVMELRLARLGDGFAAASRDITEHTLAKERLRSGAAELERSNAALADFAHTVSHQLSEPLGTASMFAETIEVYRGRGLDTAELIAQQRKTLALMQDRIKALLLVAQVRSGPQRSDEVDCTELVNDVLAALKGLVVATGARVSIAGLPRVHGDPDQLALLFENLLSNAMHYRRDGDPPEVAVAATRNAHSWHFTVSDQGSGIAPEDSTRIFELFGRAAGEVRPGTGIGLAVCKTVVEGHGGRIWVESGRGEGSTFHFTLA
jgi:signal transduction histidine kinase